MAATPTFATGTCDNRKGFTLLELMVVMFVVAVTLAFVLPSFPTSKGRIKADARKTASILRYVNETAVSRKLTIPLTFHIEDASVSWQIAEDKTEKIKSLFAVELQSRGRLKEGELKVFFGPMGLGEYLVVYLKEGDEEMNVSFNPISGRAKISTAK